MSLAELFSQYQVFLRNKTADYLGSLKKLVSLLGGLKILFDINNPVPKVKEFPPELRLHVAD